MEVNDAVAMYEAGTEDSDAGPVMVRTEVGLLPHDWRVSTFEGLADIQRGKFSARPRNDPKFFGGDVPFIQTGDVTRSNGRIDSYSQTLNDLGLAVSRVFPRGTMFFTIAANIGDIGFADFDAACPDSLVAVTPRASIDKYWLSYELKSRKSFFEGLATQNAQMNINLEKLRPVLLPVPSSLEEQQAIAEALSDADALIESLSLLLAKKRRIKQGAMQELLTGTRRLPGFQGIWTYCVLGDVVDSCSSGATPYRGKEDYFKGSIRWITSGELNYNVIFETLEHVSEEARKATNLKLHPPGTFLMAITGLEAAGTRGACGIVGAEATTNQSCMAIYPSAALLPLYLYYYYVFRGSELALTYCQGTKQQSYTARLVKMLPIAMPSGIEEQRAIVQVLSEMDDDIAAVEVKLSKARQLKQGMLQQLLTGRIRLEQPAPNVVPLPTKSAPTRSPTSTHNWQINEAVVIAVLAQRFGNEQFPLPRKRRVKLMYLLHRHAEGKAEGYLKKAAGPYDPNTKYKGPEQIALKNGYVRALRNGTYEGFVAGDKIEQAQGYFEQWYGPGALEWLERFRYLKTDELELLATVDMAMVDLAANGESADLAGVKRIIAAHPEWVPKLSREVFSDDNIAQAIAECAALFPA